MTTQPQPTVHGLDGTLVEPDWPSLTLPEVRQLLAGFPSLGEPLEIAWTSPRPLSAAALVRAERSSVFVKRHHRSVRDRDGLHEEHRFLDHLLAHRVSVPRVLRDSRGETAIEAGDWTYEVHSTAPGIDLYADVISWQPFTSAAHARAAGAALAALHLASESFSAPARKPQPLVASFSIFSADDPADGMETYLRARPLLDTNTGVRRCAVRALDLLASFHGELHPHLAHLESLWTHNDLHCSNLLWSDATEHAQATAIIDFGLADSTNAVHDLAHAIERNIVEWLALVQHPDCPEEVPLHLEDLEALLDGYQSVRPLSAHEAAALAPTTALCHAEFALSESEYFLGPLHSEEKARMAYDGWLVGHAEWFRCARGASLLDAIRRWAARSTSPDFRGVRS